MSAFSRIIKIILGVAYSVLEVITSRAMQWRNGRWVGVSRGGPGGVIDLEVMVQRHSVGR